MTERRKELLAILSDKAEEAGDAELAEMLRKPPLIDVKLEWIRTGGTIDGLRYSVQTWEGWQECQELPVVLQQQTQAPIDGSIWVDND